MAARFLYRRREFITLLGGAAAGWPLAARAQQGERMRRIGVLMPAAADDAEFQARVAAFLQGLQQLGWTIGRNVRIDTRWAAAEPRSIRKHAAELVALAPDVILAAGTATVAPLLQATRTVPIVFAIVADPVGAGSSIAWRGRAATPPVLPIFEYGMAGKWLELLKQIAPRVTRVAVLRDPTIASGIGQFAAVQAVAPSLGVELSPVNVRDAPEIERAVTAFARSNHGGLIVTASALANRHRELIVDAGGPAHACPQSLRTPFRRRRRPDLLRARSLDQYRRQRAMSTASSRARSRPTCRCRRRPSTSW